VEGKLFSFPKAKPRDHLTTRRVDCASPVSGLGSSTVLPTPARKRLAPAPADQPEWQSDQPVQGFLGHLAHILVDPLGAEHHHEQPVEDCHQEHYLHQQIFHCYPNSVSFSN